MRTLWCFLLLLVSTYAELHTTSSQWREQALWLDEGESATATVTEWGYQSTFCFHSNASLHLRLDTLNSTMQPPYMRFLSNIHEVESLYRLTGVLLSKAEKYMGSVSWLWWSWSNLLLVVDSTQWQDLQFYYTRSPGSICQMIQHGLDSTPSLTAHFPSEVVSWLHYALYLSSQAFCESCVNGCPLECTPVTSGGCVLLLSPFHSPCVTLEAPSQPMFPSSRPSISISTAFYTVLSIIFPQNLILGFVFVLSANRLARSRTFHYFLGALLGVTFSIFLALYFFQRQTRSFSRAIPGYDLLAPFQSLLSLLVPFTSVVVLPAFYQFVAWTSNILLYFWSQETVFGVPHLGKVYFMLFGVFGMLLVWWYEWGKTPETAEELEEVPTYGHPSLAATDDEEDLPLTTFQVMLERLLTASGLVLLFYSTSTTEASLLLVTLVMLRGWFYAIYFALYYWYYAGAPGKHSIMISREEYDAQAKTTTERELKKLQKYIKKHPDVLDTVDEDNEVRVRRFARGRRKHFEMPPEWQEEKSSSYCTVQ